MKVLYLVLRCGMSLWIVEDAIVGFREALVGVSKRLTGGIEKSKSVVGHAVSGAISETQQSARTVYVLMYAGSVLWTAIHVAIVSSQPSCYDVNVAKINSNGGNPEAKCIKSSLPS